jgi:para-nitrobenzyl esterase
MSILNTNAARGSVISLLGAFAILAASPVTAQIVATPVPGDPVSIDSGAVSGKVLSSGVKAYFGIPFAAPPLGDLRWRAPQQVEAWKGVYHADRLAPECIQVLRRHNPQSLFR